jgi:hypothetical protein
MSQQTILDMLCGSRMFWFNKRDTCTLLTDTVWPAENGMILP